MTTHDGGDWRLPNVREMQSLLDYRQSQAVGFPLPSGHPFTGVQWAYYWTSSSVAPVPSYGWVVSLSLGEARANFKTYDYSVWPVRGGQ